MIKAILEATRNKIKVRELELEVKRYKNRFFRQELRIKDLRDMIRVLRHKLREERRRALQTSDSGD